MEGSELYHGGYKMENSKFIMENIINKEFTFRHGDNLNLDPFIYNAIFTFYKKKIYFLFLFFLKPFLI